MSTCNIYDRYWADGQFGTEAEPGKIWRALGTTALHSTTREGSFRPNRGAATIAPGTFFHIEHILLLG